MNVPRFCLAPGRMMGLMDCFVVRLIVEMFSLMFRCMLLDDIVLGSDVTIDDDDGNDDCASCSSRFRFFFFFFFFLFLKRANA